MNTKILAASLALALGAGAASSVLAQAKPEVLVKQRQAAMTLQGKYFGPLAAMAQGKIPFDAKIAARNAGFLSALSQMPWDGFDASTSGVKSEALPAIWKDSAKFKSAQDLLVSNVAKLADAAKGGDEAAIKTASAAVGKACGGCHDNFREKK